MKYAVIAISGSQFKVQENEILTVDNLNLKEGETGKVEDVLLSVNDDQVVVGTPNVPKASVEYKVVKNYQGDKLRIFKYRHKSRYQKTMGFRAQLTDIQITKIN
ncbi:MAG TPA: 50S ribosomal protein L21 [Patescibacteria group bacterium]